MSTADEVNATPARRHPPFLLYAIYSLTVGAIMYLVGVLAFIPRYFLGLDELLTPASEALVWYSGVPVVLGFSLAALDLLLLFEGKRRGTFRYDPPGTEAVTVALTAYNDEDSIAEAVTDFLKHPKVRQVIVVSNQSDDRTVEFAEAAGALVVNEERRGYGRCVFRCFEEAISRCGDDLVVLCEGDRSFRAYDIEKLMAYIPHGDIVNGTRTVEPLRQPRTQLTTFMFYGNLFVAKLLEAKHLGRGTITDVGTTYKLCRRDALERLLPLLDPAVNLEFNAHFIDRALASGLTLVECPITFHERVGPSKGGNVSDLRALAVGLRMIRGITFGWRSA